MKTGKTALIVGITALAAAVALVAIAAPKAFAAEKYESTDEYRAWLYEINETCKEKHNPLEDKEGFWNCLEEEEQRNPPPEDHLKPQG